jgi:hypothetical protein
LEQSGFLAQTSAAVMPIESPPERPAAESKGLMARWQWEAAGILFLVALTVYFAVISWRKWPDPVIDSGPQWYAAWRVSHGALPYHDFLWNYGPLSVYFNGFLFKWFGPGMMVLVAANLVIYTLILLLAYFAFRSAWGRIGAFAAAAVFIAVFSFSHLTSVANYNFVTPYAHESTHGMLLILATLFVAVRWSTGASPALAFLLGLCGGMAMVLKPEFMLAGSLLGIATLLLRHVQRLPVRATEYGLLVAGLVLPMFFFAAWFSRVEPWKTAFIDANQAWWLALVERIQSQSGDQQTFAGLSRPWANAWLEVKAGAIAIVVIAAICAAGYAVNRPWRWATRIVCILGGAAIAFFARIDGGWFWVGRCLPLLLLMALAVATKRLWSELSRRPGESTVMAFALALVALAMLARMLFWARIYHLGFFQAALAGMVVAAFMVAEVPGWTGAGSWGRCLARFGCFALLATACISIAVKSHRIYAEQTVPIGSGRDRFYVFNGAVDETGMVVDWVTQQLLSAPPEATLVVLPEGMMVNYLTRRVNPVGAAAARGGEQAVLKQLEASPPEYIVLLAHDPKPYGINRFGTPGNSGRTIVEWLGKNYSIAAAGGGDPLIPEQMKAGATIVRRKPPGERAGKGPSQGP